MMKKLLLVLFLSFVVVGNIDAQKHKRTMKPKKKGANRAALLC